MEFPEGWGEGFLEEHPICEGGMDLFSGTTH